MVIAHTERTCKQTYTHTIASQSHYNHKNTNSPYYATYYVVYEHCRAVVVRQSRSPGATPTTTVSVIKERPSQPRRTSATVGGCGIQVARISGSLSPAPAKHRRKLPYSLLSVCVFSCSRTHLPRATQLEKCVHHEFRRVAFARALYLNKSVCIQFVWWFVRDS